MGYVWNNLPNSKYSIYKCKTNLNIINGGFYKHILNYKLLVNRN